jgi:hypothetical protein
VLREESFLPRVRSLSSLTRRRRAKGDIAAMACAEMGKRRHISLRKGTVALITIARRKDCQHFAIVLSCGQQLWYVARTALRREA